MAQTFDEQELLKRVDNDMVFLGEILQMLETDGRALMAQVKADLAANDAAALNRDAHSLKGMILHFCAAKAQELAFQIEKAGRANDCAAGQGPATQLEPLFEELLGELKSFVAAKA